ncbi:MAG TPA: DUF5668 domain-containing protein [Thermoanaerobaculia bacterium]|nr:DUF5668 domain-containing protein [Thermoanaerobaculia bacterium]
MTEDQKESRAASLIGGIVLLTIGGLFLAEELGVADFSDVVRSYWPMIIVAVGVGKLFRRETFGRGIWLIALGTLFQIVHLGAFGLRWSTAWPFILIFIGAGIVGRAVLEGMRREGDAGGRSNS